MCVNYIDLNKHMLKNKFLVPKIEDIFDKLYRACYLNTTDSKNSCHKIRIVLKKASLKQPSELYLDLMRS